MKEKARKKQEKRNVPSQAKPKAANQSPHVEEQQQSKSDFIKPTKENNEVR